MENKNKQTDRSADLQEILEQFPENERAEAKEIWELTKKARHQKKSTSSKEIEDALKNVHFRINNEQERNNRNSRIAGVILSNSRYLVAAVALIVLGLGFLFVPKTVMVPHAEIAEIVLPDGSSVELNSGTTLQYTRLFAFTNRNLTLNGEAYFLVEEGKENPFVVEANGAAIKVTGTEFNVRSWANDPNRETIVTVTEGSVDFFPLENQSNTLSLNAGQTSRLNPNMISPEAPAEARDEALAWRENRIVFQETALIVILNNLERTFDVNIDLDVDGMEYETLTAYYNQPADIESILEDICTVKGLRYTKTTNGYRIFK